MELRNRFLSFTACAALLLPSIASAVPVLPEAVYIAALATSVQPMQEYRTPGTYTLAGSSTTVDGSPSLAGNVHTSSDVIESVESIIHYGFAVVGPVNNIAVPIFVDLMVDANVSGALLSYSRAAAQVRVEHQFGSFAIAGARVDASSLTPHPGRITATLPITMIAGAVGGIWMQIDVGAAGVGAVAEAFADPYLYVDPAFLATHPGYTVMVSSGIGNTAPVPEPGTYVMFAVGLGLVGWKVRCRIMSSGPAPQLA